MLSICLDNITKGFNKKIAVDSIRLKIPSGTFFGFLGPNGAGKTTTIRMIAGLLRPDSGRVFIKEKEIDIHEKEWKKQIGLLSDELGFFYRLTLWEHLLFIGQLYGLGYTETISRGEELLRYLDVWDSRDTKAFEASHGTKKKLGLALSLIHNPEIILLDEPFEGIDFVAAKKIRELLIILSKRGKTIFLTSHILEIVEQVIDSFTIIVNGRIVAESTMAGLKASHTTLPDLYSSVVGGYTGNPESDLAWIN